MRQTNWVVITGGPSSGKSTLVEYLKSQGYSTIPETARTLIDKEFAKGKTLSEIRKDEKVFQQKVLQMKISLEGRLPSKKLVFFDRGIPDSIAYYELYEQDIAPIIQVSQKNRYKVVFLLEQIPFKKDYVRTENQKRAREISKLLFKAYSRLGYDVVKVPLMSVQERTEFILRELNRF